MSPSALRFRSVGGARMTVRFSRRDALLRTAAIAAAGVIPGAPFPGVAAPLRASSRSGEIDAVLQARVDAAEVPGVVAMAATEHSVIYQGAFGVRSMGAAAQDVDRYRLPYRLDGQTADLRRSAATRRTRQAQTGRTGGNELIRRSDRRKFSMASMRKEPRNCAPREKAHHAAPSADAYIRASAISFGTRTSFAMARLRATIRRCRARR